MYPGWLYSHYAIAKRNNIYIQKQPKWEKSVSEKDMESKFKVAAKKSLWW